MGSMIQYKPCHSFEKKNFFFLFYFITNKTKEMSAEYGTVHTRDEETPLVGNQVPGNETFLQKVKRVLHLHGHRVLISWIVIIAITAVLTLSFHFSLKGKHDTAGDEQKPLLEDMCVSDRSWFVALMLSIFLGPFGKYQISFTDITLTFS